MSNRKSVSICRKLNEELTFKTRIRAYQSRNASACQAPSSAYKRGRARPEMVKHALTNGGYFQTLSFVCITYYYTHTQINDFMCPCVEIGLTKWQVVFFGDNQRQFFGTMASGSSNSDGQRDITVRTQNKM